MIHTDADGSMVLLADWQPGAFFWKQIHAYEQKIWHFGYLYHPESQRMPEIFYGRYHRDICRDIFCWGGLCDRIQGISF